MGEEALSGLQRDAEQCSDAVELVVAVVLDVVVARMRACVARLCPGQRFASATRLSHPGNNHNHKHSVITVITH